MRQLYKICGELEMLIRALDDHLDETGTTEIPTAATEKLEALKLEREEKAVNIGRLIKSLAAQQEMIDAEKRTLAQRSARLDDKIEWLKAYLSRFLTVGETYGDGAVRISWRPSEFAEVLDERAIPEEFIKTTREVKRRELLRELKAGMLVAGAALGSRDNIQIK